jgi:hypothetical protein
MNLENIYKDGKKSGKNQSIVKTKTKKRQSNKVSFT